MWFFYCKKIIIVIYYYNMLNNYIEGRSGSKIEFINNNGVILFRKYSNSIKNNNRFLSQINKQKNSILLTPKIINICKEDLYYCDMEYINGINYYNYLNNCEVSNIFTVIDTLISYIETNINTSILINPPQEKIKNKIISVKNNISFSNDIILATYDYLNNNMPEELILSGSCHGDLTFSNMIFYNNFIYFFDFLDSFVESPIIDIVKLKQDSKFFYTPFINNNVNIKILQILKYLDNKINDVIRKNVYIYIWYKYFEIFNLFRILPYLSKNNEINYILNAIKCQLI